MRAKKDTSSKVSPRCHTVPTNSPIIYADYSPLGCHYSRWKNSPSLPRRKSPHVFFLPFSCSLFLSGKCLWVIHLRRQLVHVIQISEWRACMCFFSSFFLLRLLSFLLVVSATSVGSRGGSPHPRQCAVILNSPLVRLGRLCCRCLSSRCVPAASLCLHYPAQHRGGLGRVRAARPRLCVRERRLEMEKESY